MGTIRCVVLLVGLGLVWSAAPASGQASNVVISGGGTIAGTSPGGPGPLSFTWPVTSLTYPSFQTTTSIGATIGGSFITLTSMSNKTQSGAVGSHIVADFDLATDQPYTLTAFANYSGVFMVGSGHSIATLDGVSYDYPGESHFSPPFFGLDGLLQQSGAPLTGVFAAGHHVLSFSSSADQLGAFVSSGETLQFVPEPGSVGILVLGGLALLRGRRCGARGGR